MHNPRDGHLQVGIEVGLGSSGFGFFWVRVREKSGSIFTTRTQPEKIITQNSGQNKAGILHTWTIPCKFNTIYFNRPKLLLTLMDIFGN